MSPFSNFFLAGESLPLRVWLSFCEVVLILSPMWYLWRRATGFLVSLVSPCCVQRLERSKDGDLPSSPFLLLIEKSLPFRSLALPPGGQSEAQPYVMSSSGASGGPFVFSCIGGGENTSWPLVSTSSSNPSWLLSFCLCLWEMEMGLQPIMKPEHTGDSIES